VSAQARCHILRVSCDAAWLGVIEDVTSTLQRVHPARPVHLVRGLDALIGLKS